MSASSAPQARTRLARAAVIDAARHLFVDRGYGATTVAAVSERSGVPAATLYRLFPSKLHILKALVDVSIAGDDRPVAVADRPEIRAPLDRPEPASQLAEFVSVVGAINARVAPIHAVLVSAAGTDAGAARLLEEIVRQRQAGQAMIARALASAGALRDGLTERDAADIVHALLSPEIYRLLVIDRGWTPARLQRWLTDALVGQLVAPVE